MSASTALQPIRSQGGGTIALVVRAESHRGGGDGAGWDEGVDVGPAPDVNGAALSGVVGNQGASPRQLQIRSEPGHRTTTKDRLPARTPERVG